MIRRPPRSTRTDTLFPYPTLVRSAVAVRGVDDDQVAFGFEQRLGAFDPRIAGVRCGGDTQAAVPVLGGVGEIDRLFHILDGDQADAVIFVVDDELFFDAALDRKTTRHNTSY